MYSSWTLLIWLLSLLRVDTCVISFRTLNTRLLWNVLQGAQSLSNYQSDSSKQANPSRLTSVWIRDSFCWIENSNGYPTNSLDPRLLMLHSQKVWPVIFSSAIYLSIEAQWFYTVLNLTFCERGSVIVIIIIYIDTGKTWSACTEAAISQGPVKRILKELKIKK